jgi:Ni/Fe-hydrogenase subunit HybB-like protein
MGWDKLVKIQHAITLPIVMVGVVLSTLHQSSLGGLFLIVPGKLYPLWYSQMLPLLFFISAMCMGLAMVIVLSRISARAFGRTLELPILSDLSRVLLAGLWVYGVTRMFDLVNRGSFALALQPTYEALMFWLEFAGGVILPIAILFSKKRRASARLLYTAGIAVVFGFLMNRLNVSITGFEAAQGGHYVPAWPEVFITLMIVAMVFAAYALAVRFLNVYPEVTERRSGRLGPSLATTAATLPAGKRFRTAAPPPSVAPPVDRISHN